MRKYISILFPFLFLANTACYNQSDNVSTNTDFLTIGTFNIAWLGDGENDMIKRTEGDYQRLAEVIISTKADILALQEIENEDAMRKLTNYLPGYEFVIDDSGGNQNLAFLYKTDIEIISSRIYRPIAVINNRTRPGFIIEARKDKFDFIAMTVHFKSTSRYDDTNEKRAESRQIRKQQAEIASRWVDSVLAGGAEKDLILLGDMNDYPMRKNNNTLDVLAADSNITFLTSSLKSCKFVILPGIDHIIVTNSAAERYQQNSLRLYDLYSAYNSGEVKKLSDHCPVLVMFDATSKDND